MTTLLALSLAGCAAHPDPIVDMKGVNPEAFAKDWDECEKYTEEIQISQGVAKGGATGAVVGALGGAIDGDAGKGAAGGAEPACSDCGGPGGPRCINVAQPQREPCRQGL